MADSDPQLLTIEPAARRVIATNLAVTGLLFLLMVLVGLTMRLAQSGWLPTEDARFYQVLTLHGTGMVGLAALGGMSVMWYFLSQYVRLSTAVLAVNLVLFLAGVLIILVADLGLGFGAAWTFLYPLPAHSSGVWEASAAFWHLFGLLLVGVGFLLVCIDIGRALIARYGGLLKALGWPQLFGMSDEPLPPPAVVASAMSIINAGAAIIGGAVIIILSIINLLVPAFEVDALLAKNIIYFFGHVFINATIYMGVISVYELLPGRTGRKWKSSKPFLAGWAGSTIMVLVIFPHHLLMDLVMPRWVMILAQILSYTNSFPVMVITGLGALAIVHRSGIRWDVVGGLLFAAMFGWMAGVVPAVVDATIVVNSVMHNTLWVPGHFHFYLLLGLMPMIIAFMYHFIHDRTTLSTGTSDGWAVGLYLVAGFGFVVMFLYGGFRSVPRRWSVHLPAWMPYDRIASVFAAIVLLTATFLVARFLLGLRRASADK